MRDHACDEMQGFLFSRPLPPEKTADLLRPSRFWPRRRCNPMPDQG
jgi:EAL domain-containing protein (putative c-di-GMP-specific phosphodiesterase class I)